MAELSTSTLRSELVVIGTQTIVLAALWSFAADPNGLTGLQEAVFPVLERNGWLALPFTVLLVSLTYSIGAATDGLFSLLKALIEKFTVKSSREERQLARIKFPEQAKRAFRNDFDQRVLRASSFHVLLAAPALFHLGLPLLGWLALFFGLAMLGGWFRRLHNGHGRMEELIKQCHLQDPLTGRGNSNADEG